MDGHGHTTDEETPLILFNKPKPTPLPKKQLACLLMLQLAEPISSQVIYPFIAQLIASLPITGGNPEKVGYYAGLIESIFFAVEALTILQWSRASDFVGRKPVLLVGLSGLCLSMLGFGLSTTFASLVISRSLCGLLNGNIGVMKTMMAEISDSTNRAQAFAFLPIIWAAGATVGPFIGGSLARPGDRFPEVFSSPFWIKYPYFLPCLVSASFTAFVMIFTVIFLKETVQNRTFPPFLRFKKQDTPVMADSGDKPRPLRELLIRPVVTSVGNYCYLAFLDIMLMALRPLFYAMPVEAGGFGLSPATIGACLGFYGFACGAFQLLFFARIVNRLGPKRVFMMGLTTSIVIFALFPITHFVVSQQGQSNLAWFLLALGLCLSPIMDMCFGTVAMFITVSAPNNRSLGTVNGMAQTSGSIMRACGPALVSSIFSLSVEWNILGGYGVYAFLVVAASGSLLTARLLPDTV